MGDIGNVDIGGWFRIRWSSPFAKTSQKPITWPSKSREGKCRQFEIIYINLYMILYILNILCLYFHSSNFIHIDNGRKESKGKFWFEIAVSLLPETFPLNTWEHWKCLIWVKSVKLLLNLLLLLRMSNSKSKMKLWLPKIGQKFSKWSTCGIVEQFEVRTNET